MTWNALLLDTTEPEDLEDVSDVVALTSSSDYESEAAMRADVDRFDVIVVQTYEIDEELLGAADALSLVAKRGVGVDNIDTDAATERGVLVCNTPGANARAVGEHALTLVLSVRHRVLAAHRETIRGAWPRDPFVTSEVGGDVLGTFGLGNTGRMLARLADGIGMDVVAYDPYVDADALPASVDLVETSAELFERADVASVHAPLTGETRGAVGTAELDRLGADGILVNTARGGVVDEDALVAALREGRIAGAGLDVYEQEPPGEDHPLFAFDSVVLTPHVAGATVEANAEKYRKTAENVRTVYEGGIPETALNPDAGH